MYTSLHASGQSKSYVVHDLALPYSSAEQFMNYTDKVFGICPLPLPSKLNTDDAPAFEANKSIRNDRKAYARHWSLGLRTFPV